MFRFVKTFFVILKNLKSSISLGSDISPDCIIGNSNKIKSSRIYNSTINNNCTINKASAFSSNLGNYVKVYPEVILFSGKISDYVYIGVKTAISQTSIHRYTYLAGNNRIFNTNIGAFCSIAENVCIGHAEHPYHQFSTSPVFYKTDNPLETTKFVQQEIDEFKTTIIGNDVWIGYNAYIRSGVTIGDGCIIGAGAIVTKNIEPYCVVAGVPARVIKKRFDEATILKLQQDQWWDLDDEKLLEYSKQNFIRKTRSV